MKKRASGVLMHITSLPGKQGVGTFGQEHITSLISWLKLIKLTGKFYH